MISTIHRRHILSFLEKEKAISLNMLKRVFVESKEMNQTTLYRIMNKFVTEGVVHRVEFLGEKYFILCQCHEHKTEAIRLRCCINCHNIEDHHTPLPIGTMKSETIELIDGCNKCR